MGRTRYSSLAFSVPARTWEANIASRSKRLRLYDSRVSPNGKRSRPGKIELYKESFPNGMSLINMNAKLNNVKRMVAFRRMGKRRIRGLFCCICFVMPGQKPVYGRLNNFPKTCHDNDGLLNAKKTHPSA